MFLQKQRIASLPLLLIAASLMQPGNYAQQLSPRSSQVSNQADVRIAFDLRPAKGLTHTITPADIQLIYDGKPQSIRSLEHFTDKPVSLALVIDTSLSQERLERSSKQIASSFVETAMRSGIDQVAVVGFRGNLLAEQELTTDHADVFRAIGRLEFAKPTSYVAGVLIGSDPTSPEAKAFGATAVWDTIKNVSEGLSLPAMSHPRRAILLLSNGEDTFSRATVSEAADEALRRGVTVYAIGINDKDYGDLNSDHLKKITSKTGGRAFFPKTFQDLPAIFAQLTDELRAQYVVTYARSSAGPVDLSKVKIRVSGPLKDALVVFYGEYAIDSAP